MNSTEIRRRFEAMEGDDFVPPLETEYALPMAERMHRARPLSSTPEYYRQKRREYTERANAAMLDGYELCVVPGCMVWSRNLSAKGTCPMKLWDDHHYEYAVLKVAL